jgi:putative transcriptional regulator
LNASTSSVVNTLRHWEQGSRQPEGPTRAYLLVIERAPKAVQKALQAV